MDSTLVAVTLLSMGMAVVLSVIVWRMLRDERVRGDARVAALSEMAAVQPSELFRRAPERLGAPLRRASELDPTPLDLALHAAPAAPAPVQPMFAEAVHESPWPRRIAVMACIALAAASVILVTLTMRDRGRMTGAGAPASAARAASTASARLDLLSLRDARAAGALTITGLVQNPTTGSRLDRVSVTAYAFDASGAFLASGRALLDVTALAPGDESPFVVTVAAGDAVSRYRITFRGEDGSVIGHVDRRQQTMIAANWSN